METKYCKYCGESINKNAVICVKCGSQVEELKVKDSSRVFINNNIHRHGGYREKNKWIALALCIFLGIIGAHKFYENKIGLGILYIFTGALFGFGIIYDIISILCKPNYYYVKN